jgi:DNA-binding transcriptional regulator YiaG
MNIVAPRYRAGYLTNKDFKRIRQGLLLTQKELAAMLGYSHKIRISEFERETNPAPIPQHIQEALLAIMANDGKPPRKRQVRIWQRHEDL